MHTMPHANVLRPPHLCGGRRLQPGQLIHESAVKYLKESSSKCKARVFDKKSGSWDHIQNHLRDLEIVEDSQSKVIDATIKQLGEARQNHSLLPDNLVYTLHELISSG